MIGHAALIAMRRKGRAPAWVEIETDEVTDRRLAREWPAVLPGCAQLIVNPAETLARLDLRCLLELQVRVQGSDPERVEAVVSAAIEAGARRVLGSVFRPARGGFEVARMTDTEGTMTWPA